MKNEYVYFLATTFEGEAAVKIGWSKQPEKRCRTLEWPLEAITPESPPKLLCYVPGNRDTEQYLHHFFKLNRIGGEWFRPKEYLYRMLIHCARNGTLPQSILNAAAMHRKMSEAKRARNALERTAKDSFKVYLGKNGYPFGPGPARCEKNSIDWLPVCRKRMQRKEGKE